MAQGERVELSVLDGRKVGFCRLIVCKVRGVFRGSGDMRGVESDPLCSNGLFES
jgi:hypothetical protein